MKQTLLKFSLGLSFVICPLSSVVSQPRYDMKTINREKLNRGVVAIRSGEKVIVSWRTLTSDAVGESFDVYRDGQKLNASPLCKGGTFFVDEQPLTRDAVYEIRGGGKNGKYTLRADAPDGYLPAVTETV